jgi:hypothetical protein
LVCGLVVGAMMSQSSSAVGAGGVLSALRSAVESKDMEKIASLLYAEHEDDRLALTSVAEIAIAGRLFDEAVRKTFPDESKVGSVNALGESVWSAVDEKVKGVDEIEVTIGKGAGARVFLAKRMGEVWKLPVSIVSDRPQNATLIEVGGRYSDIAAAIRYTFEELQTGEIPSAHEAMRLVKARMDEAARGMHVQ